jgi:DNA-directed RNA polymerase subunit RPC12/RpoP
VSKCPYCGAEFEEGVEEAPGALAEKPSEAEMAECPSCGKPVGLTVAVCPHCGLVFESEEEAPPASLSFPKKVPKKEAPARPTPAVIAPPAKIEKIFLRLVRPVDLKVIIGFAAFGAIMLFLAYSAQVDLNGLGTPTTPAGEHELAALEGKRNVYLLTASGCLFLALFGAALPAERVAPVHVLQNQMLSTARATGDYCKGNSLDGNALYLPAKHGLTRERVFIPMSAGYYPPKQGLSDSVTALSNGNGSVGAVLLEPLGLSLLDHVEGELNIKMSGAGLETVENTLQRLKHDYSILKDFHFKERGDRTVLRVEYGGLANACSAVRKERPQTCRQNSCFGCACMLSAAARATGKMVRIESVDNAKELVEFTISFHDW